MAKSQKDLLFTKSGNSIYNDEIRNYLQEHISSFFEKEKFNSMQCQTEYIDTFLQWIKSSRNNRIQGLDTFQEKVISLGVTQALDQFHYDIIKNNKRLRLFRGEYPYNRDVHPFRWDKDFIDDRKLEEEDAVIISCPFSGSGDVHPKMREVLDQCENLKIPVFIDMAWFGTCGGLDIDLSHPAITDVGFSLTKGLTCGNYRSGIRISRKVLPTDRLKLHLEWQHGIHLNTRIGLLLMKRFSPDTQFNKYRDKQLKVCLEYSLEPSLCVHIAKGDDLWNEYSRDGAVNRINLREAIKKY